jgi:hypothetical protein
MKNPIPVTKSENLTIQKRLRKLSTMLFGKLQARTHRKRQRPIPEDIRTVESDVSLLSGSTGGRHRTSRRGHRILRRFQHFCWWGKKQTGNSSVVVPISDDDSNSEHSSQKDEVSEAEKLSKLKEFILYDEKNGRPVPPAPSSSFWCSPIAFQVYFVIAITILFGDPRFLKGTSIILLLQLVKVSLQWADFVYQNATHEMSKSIF